MADYFLADVHLRHDRPDRGRRLARLVDRLGPADRLYVVGDLCDFWLASRQRRRDPMSCEGLRSLAEYRGRGGHATLFAGNHDAWLADDYTRAFAPTWVEDSLRVESHGLRLHLAHGHRLGARSPWKAAMESRGFLRWFAMLPAPIADALERRLETSNDARREADEDRHLALYRRFAATLRGEVDLVLLGHVHRVCDEPGPPRLVVPGGWHRRTSYLRVDETGASEVVEDDPAGAATPIQAQVSPP